MRRLRREFKKTRIRFFACGEYGEKHSRPHFHACLFNFRPQDGEQIQQNLYRSPTLERLWPHGFSSFGDLTFESAAYVARYVCKKVTGDLAPQHYETVCLDTGEIIQRTPEMANMSRRPGIGHGWLQRFHRDAYSPLALGKIVMRGVECNTPRYYNKIMSSDVIMDDVEYSRHVEAVKRAGDNTPSRLAVREKVAHAKLKESKRTL